MEEENKNVGAEATTKNTGTTEVTGITTEQKIDYAEMMKTNKELQSFVDSQKTQAIKTAVENAKVKWEEENKTKQAEAERLAKMDEDQKKSYELQQANERASKAESELNAYKLKDETIRQARDRDISLGYLDTINFAIETAESINQKLDIFEKTSKAEREKAISEYSKEPPPKTGDRVSQKSLSELKTYEEIAKYYEEHPDAK